MKLHLLDDMRGRWKYQKTIYDLNRKSINNYKQCIDISIADIKQMLVIDQKTLANSKTYSTITLDNNILNKVYSYYNISYKVKLKLTNQLNITYKKKQVNFQEKVYVINSNFFIVIGMIKQYNKYLSISFTSFIKIV
uniref:Uncharacterized protein n=1 Tax=Gayliella sp. TaxID=2575623 RepID=A0A4D6WVM8_9FLOR|nr:hypothetical protein [Gayliella sp.]